MTSTEEKSFKAARVSDDFLIRGSEYLAQHPEFKLEGRQTELLTAAEVLMKRDNNNLLIHGQNGVGLSSIIMGLQASKENLDTPFDIVGKRFYYLDIDALFSSGDTAKINEGFKKAMATLTRAPDTVLVIEGTKDFLDGLKNSGTSNLMNQLMREARKNPKFQVVFEARDETLPDLFKSHSDVVDIFSTLEVREPNKEELKGILKNFVADIEAYHGIPIAPEAIDAVTDLTTKYPGLTLGTAQPKRSKMILENALVAYRRKAHARPPALDALEEDLQDVTESLQTGKPAGVFSGKSSAELEVIKLEIEKEIQDVKADWDDIQKKIRVIYKEQRDGEDEVTRISRDIENLEEEESFIKEKQEALKAPNADKEKIRRDYFDRTGKNLPEEKEIRDSFSFSSALDGAGFNSPALQKLYDKRSEYEALVAENTKKYAAITKDMDKDLVLTDTHIFSEFSRLSGLPISKLNEDETDRLINLDETLSKRVFGQDAVVKAVADYVRFGRQGMKDENKPVGNFLFVGPSGTGKTELVKALAEALFGDERLVTRFDMGGFQEKNNVATLVGAPRGYEGYAEGGLLTNAVRKRPNSIVLFDEIEKAHVDIFDLLLPVFDEGSLMDTRGMVATFGGVVNIMTSNIGSQYFMDPNLSYEEAVEKAKGDLYNRNKETGGSGLRLEFLNRIDGIFFFKSLGTPQIELIAGKALKKLNQQIEKKGLQVDMSPAELAAMCEDNYKTPEETRQGGRGIQTYINQHIKPDISLTMLKNGDKRGKISVTYNKAAHKPDVNFVPDPDSVVPFPADRNVKKISMSAHK